MNMPAPDQFIAKFPKRAPDAHKGDFGHVLVIAGSSGYTGAAYLASQAAILSGSGLVTLAVGKSLYPIMATKLVEVMVKPFFETKDYSLSLLAEKDLLSFSERCNCLAIGPGISQNKETQHLVRNLITKLPKPIVLDADGINAFVGHLDMLGNAQGKLVLTPHPGELARLIEKDVGEVQRKRKDIALNFANEYNTVLVLKGYNTIVASPGGECYINETGNAGMATGGVGDILTGMIASFIGQGADAFTASILGAYFHGLAGDLAQKESGILSLIATDLLNKLPEALKKLA
ncbi:MAG: NAD(P)H-hydrate dehydratase [Candidatus Omnitrophota bacterium]|nr:NAD(P)H-hydrate dehydratase [Candidatus Omnitrophota bacterium]